MAPYSGGRDVSEYVILVDENDCQIGLEEKVKCHLPDGKLHRAFTALIFDKSGNLLLTRRAKEKMLWPGDWDGTVASHPRESETYISSAQRRMPEELGISCDMEYMLKFEYHIPYKNVGSENEICAVLMGVVDAQTKLSPINGEIDETLWVSAAQLLQYIKNTPKAYCPWMLIALAVLDKSDDTILEKHASILSGWTDTKIRDSILEAIKIHLSDEQWRMR
ncbi:MAG: isopentenyl-diphosphate Delta-isomerase [Thaumarchaeota archaeon]|nr:isopentenyl-diphosphate Delta-isomerase [Nitrososphaerota archaeon]